MSSRQRTECRSCGSTDLREFLDLGDMPLSDGLRTPEQVEAGGERRYPLAVTFCGECSLAQILEEVDPDELFCDDYPYFSSFSDHLLTHSEANVERLIEARSLDADSLVVELASNDGYLLQYFDRHGVPVLGIDPAAGPVEAARQKGIPTIEGFFTLDLAAELVAQGKRADVVIGNNVMAHVPDLNGFVAGIAELLTETGVTSIEAPYVRDLIDHCEFDTIYHEHLCYFSVTGAERLFRRHGLFLNSVTHLTIHGGSMRYCASKTADPDGSVERVLAEERELGLDRYEYFVDFGERVIELRRNLRDLVLGLRDDGASVAAYGAAAKGAILLNYAGLGKGEIDFVVDRNPHKQGKFMPGFDIPILPVEALLERRPDYTLILPWNFQAEIVSQQSEYRSQGGRFLVPVPQPQILEDRDAVTHQR